MAEKKFEEAESFLNLGIVLDGKGRVLIIRRARPETGRNGSVLNWAFPGGRQRFGETREECVKREVLAETGYAIWSVKQIALDFHPQFPVMIVYHLCQLSSLKPVAQPQEPHEVAEIKWAKPREIKGLITTALNPSVARELGIDK